MAIDQHYIPAFSIEDALLDKDTGAPLSGGLVYFEQDNQRGTLKPVYQITGTSPNYSYTQLPNPMTLSSIGTFQDSMDNPVIPYFYPYDANLDPEYYFVRVTSSEDVPQFTREAVPYIPTSGDSAVLSAFVNELSNPQFAEVFFDSPITYSFNSVSNEVVSIAPGWDIVVTSPAAGTVTLEIITPTGSLNRVTNPGTILSLDSSGLTSFVLRQRIFGSPNLWGSGYLAATFIAKTFEGTSSTLDMMYSQSNGVVVDQVLSSATLTADGLYDVYPGSALIPVSTSTEFFPDAYVDIFFDIPLSQNIAISSTMVVFTGEVSVDNVLYDQCTLGRQIDQLFHYYKPGLDFKPIPSYLVGWDFPLNPAQANGDAVAAPAVANAYTWDQTILFQNTVSRVATTRAANGAMGLTVSGGTVQLAIIQYLPEDIIRSMLESTLSVNVMGDSTQADLLGSVSLWYTTNVSVPVLPLSLVTSLDANGKPAVLAAGWTEIPRQAGFSEAQFMLQAPLTSYGFNGWSLKGTNIPNTATFFAIVVGTSSIADGTVLSFNSISVVPGDVPTQPAPQTLNQVLQECQYYYEKSDDPDILPGAVSQASALTRQMLTTGAGGTQAKIYPTIFELPYKQIKRIVPTITFYDPTMLNNSGKALAVLWDAGSVEAAAAVNMTNWTLISAGLQTVSYLGNTSAALLTFNTGGPSLSAALNGYITFQYTLDSRLGIV